LRETQTEVGVQSEEGGQGANERKAAVRVIRSERQGLGQNFPLEEGKQTAAKQQKEGSVMVAVKIEALQKIEKRCAFQKAKWSLIEAMRRGTVKPWVIAYLQKANTGKGKLERAIRDLFEESGCETHGWFRENVVSWEKGGRFAV
jgi:hypothetical protein